MKAILKIQQRLADLGFDPGDIDGINGGATKGAVRNFQTTHDLKPDGIVGPKTHVLLFSEDISEDKKSLPEVVEEVMKPRKAKKDLS